jgi:hypothetical protein
LNKGLDSLLDVLRKNGDVPIPVFVANVTSPPAPKPRGASKPKSKKGAAPVDDHLVDDYVKRLEAALGDDAKFEPLLQELQADERVRQGGRRLASQFYGQTRKGTTRPKALDRVRERRVKVTEFKRQPSTSGRPAA